MLGESCVKTAGAVVDLIRRFLIVLIIGSTFGAAVFFPDWVGTRVLKLGIRKIGPEGVEISRSEVQNNVDQLLRVADQINLAIATADRGPTGNNRDVIRQLQEAGQNLATVISPQIQTLDSLGQSASVRTGWAYLGARSSDGKRWLHSGQYYTTFVETWPLQVGQTIIFTRDTNLHVDSAPEDRKTSRVENIIPRGTSATIKQLDEGRPTASSEGEPGTLVWAQVEFQPKK